MMNEVIDKLSEIETAAVNIMEHTNTKKEELSKEMEQKTLLFDQDMEQQTASQIKTMRNDMEKEIQEELSALQKSTKKNLFELQEEYDNKHTLLAKGIVNMLTGA